MGAKGAKIRVIYQDEIFKFCVPPVKKQAILDAIKAKVSSELYESIVPLLLKDYEKDKDTAYVQGTSLYFTSDEAFVLATAKHVLFEDKEEKIDVSNSFFYPNETVLEKLQDFRYRGKENFDHAFIILNRELNKRFKPLDINNYYTANTDFFTFCGIGFPSKRCKQKDDYIDSELIVYLGLEVEKDDVSSLQKNEFGIKFDELNCFENCNKLAKFPDRQGISGGPVFSIDKQLNFHIEGIFSRWETNSLIAENYDYSYAYLSNYIRDFKEKVDGRKNEFK